GFTPTTLVVYNNARYQPTFVSATQLQIAYPVFESTAGSSVYFSVTDPASGYVNSMALPLKVTPLPPTVASVTPSSLYVDQGPQQVAVAGAWFTQTSVVYVNGSARPTTLNNLGQLVVQLSAQDDHVVGNLTLTVADPASGNIASNAATLAIQ